MADLGPRAPLGAGHVKVPPAIGGHIVSYSIFRAPSGAYWRGDRTEDGLSSYARFLPTLVRAHQAIWPDWEMRLHHDHAFEHHPYFPALAKMHERGLLRLMYCGNVQALCDAMLWRLLPAFEGDDKVVLTADVDSLPMVKLRLCVDEWRASGKSFMVVHDCESHDGVMGGCMAVRAEGLRRLTDTHSLKEFMSLAGPGDWGPYASDEEYLRRTIWPMVRGEGLVFHSHGETKLPGGDVRRGPSVELPDHILPDVATHVFAPYIGSAGYDLDGALRYFSSLGSQLPAMNSIAECEDLAGVRPRDVSLLDPI